MAIQITDSEPDYSQAELGIAALPATTQDITQAPAGIAAIAPAVQAAPPVDMYYQGAKAERLPGSDKYYLPTYETNSETGGNYISGYSEIPTEKLNTTSYGHLKPNVTLGESIANIPAELLARNNITDPSKLIYVPTYEYNGETGQTMEDFKLVDSTTGNEIKGGGLGNVGGNQYGQLYKDASGKLQYNVYEPSNASFFEGLFEGVGNMLSSDAVKFLAPFVLQGVMPGLNLTPASVGSSLYGLEGTLGKIAGGATLGAGTAALTGGDVTKAAFMGGFGGAGGLNIGDTGFTLGDAAKGFNVLKAVSSGNFAEAVMGAASMAGGANVKIGDTGYTLGDLIKNGKLLQSVIYGSPEALIGALTKYASSASKDVVQSLQDSGMPQAKDFIEGYFAPGGEGYIAPKEYPPETKGNVTNDGKFEPDPLGSTTYGQMNPAVSGNIDNMKDWSVDSTGEWTRTDPVTGEKTVYEYKTPITGTAQTGADIMDKAGATASKSGTTTKSKTTTKSGKTTKSDTKSEDSPLTSTRFGLDPLDVLKMKNDVARINPLEELFGGSIYDNTPASSAHDETDIVEAATGGQVYSGGGDIHALLQLLRN